MICDAGFAKICRSVACLVNYVWNFLIVEFTQFHWLHLIKNIRRCHVTTWVGSGKLHPLLVYMIAC